MNKANDIWSFLHSCVCVCCASIRDMLIQVSMFLSYMCVCMSLCDCLFVCLFVFVTAYLFVFEGMMDIWQNSDQNLPFYTVVCVFELIICVCVCKNWWYKSVTRVYMCLCTAYFFWIFYNYFADYYSGWQRYIVFCRVWKIWWIWFTLFNVIITWNVTNEYWLNSYKLIF